MKITLCIIRVKAYIYIVCIQFNVIARKLEKVHIISKYEILCDTCNKLEDSVHFIIECDNYKCERFEKFKTLQLSQTLIMTDSKTKFIFI